MLGRSSPSPEGCIPQRLGRRAPGKRRDCDFSCGPRGPSGRPCGVRRREGEPSSSRTGGWAPSGRCGGVPAATPGVPPCRVWPQIPPGVTSTAGAGWPPRGSARWSSASGGTGGCGVLWAPPSLSHQLGPPLLGPAAAAALPPVPLSQGIRDLRLMRREV